MGKNIVICADGTGNNLTDHSSNVYRLIEDLVVTAQERQVVAYCPGIGVNIANELSSIRSEIILCESNRRFSAASGSAKYLEMALGMGLRDRVISMYSTLVDRYEDGDRIFLFGFSRGAFAVRALAGMLYRCGVYGKKVSDPQEATNRVWGIYKSHQIDSIRLREYLANYHPQPVQIHFLGLWDTVKSYGLFRSISLPHLRHNPIVDNVRHALALDECRKHFLPTTWGGLQSDAYPLGELGKMNIDSSETKVKEVWFRGSHSDIGGGKGSEEISNIAYSWMLGEASHLELLTNEDARYRHEHNIHRGLQPRVSDSKNGIWRFADYLPRRELFNSSRPPLRKFKWYLSGNRYLCDYVRDGRRLYIHDSVENCKDICLWNVNFTKESTQTIK